MKPRVIIPLGFLRRAKLDPMTIPSNSPTAEPSMLEILTAIRSIGAGFDDPYTSEYIHAVIDRCEAFEEVLLRDYPILGYCGCGSPEKTVDTILKALRYCALDTYAYLESERAVYLREHFGTGYVSDDGLVQFLFYSLDVMGLTRHSYALNASTLTPTGEVFLELLEEYVESGGKRWQMP